MSAAERRVRVVVADDHPVVRGGIEAVIARDPGFELVAAVDSGEAAVDAAVRFDADLVLMDLSMPGAGGVAATAEIARRQPDCRVLVLTSFAGDAEIHRALEAGAAGYLLKTTPGAELLSAIRAVARGLRVVPKEVASRLADRTGADELTPRELEVLSAMAEGLSNREIGERLGVAESTIKTFVLAIFGKLQVADRTQAVTTAHRRGLLRID